MALQTQTEKLREKIAELYWMKWREECHYSGYWEMDWATLVSNTTNDLNQLYVKICHDFADQILQACKEEGLKFVREIYGMPGGVSTEIEEIEIG